MVPEDFAWQGKLNGDLQLDVPARGPSGVVSLDAGSGTLRLRDQGQWVDVGYDSLRLESRLAPNRVDTSTSADRSSASCGCRRRSTRARRASR